jgi:hypothetical protein
LTALARHDVPVDVVLCDTSRGMALGHVTTEVVDLPLTGENPLVHSPGRLALALSNLLA